MPIEQRNWEEHSGVFVHLTDGYGRRRVVTPCVRENFFHNFLIPLIDLIKPGPLFLKKHKQE